jgi:hypothetical protein
MAKKKRTRRFSKINILILLMLLTVVGAGGYGVYDRFIREKAPSTQSLTKVRLKPELLLFTFEKLPDLYPELVHLNDEIILIEHEMGRLDDIASEFPTQRKIVAEEKTIWNKTLKELTKTLTTIEKDIEKSYVTFLVNEEKGRQLIESHQAKLTEAALNALEAASINTQRLKEKPSLGLFDTLIQKFF